MTNDNIDQHINNLYKIVDKRTIFENLNSPRSVAEYYHKSAFLYKKFHSPAGAMHLPIEFEKDSHANKLKYQAETVRLEIEKHGYSKVLELGCGMGFNTTHLAQSLPDVHFSGIDLTPQSIKFAKKSSKDLSNVNFRCADFDQLEVDSEKYDLIFAVETLCHSLDLTAVLKKASRMLNSNGRIVIFDGYIADDADLTNKRFHEAYKINTWGFALYEYQSLVEARNIVHSTSLKLESEVDLTPNILPNVKTFDRGSKSALKYPLLLKTLIKLRIIPLVYIKQFASGMTGTYLLYNNVMKYYKFVFVKP